MNLERLLLISLFLVPWAKSFGIPGLERVALADLTIGAALVAAILAVKRIRRNQLEEGGSPSPRIPQLALFGGLLFIIGMGISLPFSESVGRAFVETGAYGWGALFAGLLVLGIRSPSSLQRAFSAWEWGARGVFVGSVVGLALLSTGHFNSPLLDGPRLTSTFQFSGQLASYLVATLPLLWLQWKHTPSPSPLLRQLRILQIFIAAVALAGTASRSGIVLGVFVGAAVVTYTLATERQRLGPRVRPLRWVAGAVVAGLVIFAAQLASSPGLPFAFRRAVDFDTTPSSTMLQELSPARAAQWEGFQFALGNGGVAGVGPGQFKLHSTSFAPQAFRPHEMHNTLLGVWVEDGIVAACGLTLFTATGLAMGWNLVRSAQGHSRDVAFALTLSLAALLLYGVLHFGLRMRTLWAVYGLLLAAWNLERCRVPSPS